MTLNPQDIDDYEEVTSEMDDTEEEYDGRINVKLASKAYYTLTHHEDDETKVYCSAEYDSAMYALVTEMISRIEDDVKVSMDVAYRLLNSALAILGNLQTVSVDSDYAGESISEVGDVSDEISEQIDNDMIYTYMVISLLNDGCMLEWTNEKIREGAESVEQAVAWAYAAALDETMAVVWNFFVKGEDDYKDYGIPAIEEFKLTLKEGS